MAALLLMVTSPLAAEPPSASQGAGQGGPAPADNQSDACESSVAGSPYIPVDSWVYPAVWRLYSLGFVDTVYLGMRPWTRSSVNNMLDEVGSRIEDYDAGPATNEAARIYTALTRELRFNPQASCQAPEDKLRMESIYSVARGISGTPLRDSYHLGSTIINDYGRPYQGGFNNYTGVSGYASAGRFLLHMRGEFHAAPSAAGYSNALAQTLSGIDQIPFLNPATGLPYNQPTIPLGPIAAATDARFIEAYASCRLLNHEISFGKQDDWLGPGLGGGMAYSNNAENIYSFRINRTEPLFIPLLSYLTGPFRYEFLVGSLKGHTYPNDPWVHVEKISFRPTENLEFGFERTVIWGGKGHEPINLHSFLRSFFSLSAPTPAVKLTSADPGARFGAFDFSYRLPFVRNWLTLYSDSEVHDDVSPIDAPRRASWRPGIYLSHVPGIPRLDLRAEAVSTDPPITNSNGGLFMYYEGIQKQGYTNQGQLFGDWIGREDKGGQGWITYHLSGNEWFQIGVRNQKAAKDFIPGGTTLNDISFQIVKRIGKDFEINGNFAYERWKAPIYLSGQQTVTTTTIQLTWFPERNIRF
ncbi:MAG: capsule assembly Wzi family protein [Acidobacteriaceae bacterium]